MAMDGNWNRRKWEKKLDQWCGSAVIRQTVYDRGIAESLAYIGLQERRFSNEHMARASGYQPQPNSAALGSIGFSLKCAAVSQLAQGQEAGWDALPLAVAYEAWRDRLQVRIFRRFRTESTAISRLNASLTLACAITVGDTEFSRNHAAFLAEALRSGGIDKLETSLMDWLLPLAGLGIPGADPVGVAPSGLPEEYADLLAFWDTRDSPTLVKVLAAAADRHTAQAKTSDDDTTFDFDDLAYAIYPVEILAVLRLRQWRGLPNPVMDHPLLDGLLGQLAPPREIRGDELLEKVIAKADRIYPER